MKFFLCGIFLLLLIRPVHAQTGAGDTVPYTIGRIDIKKQENVLAVARRLKVDPDMLIKLNKFRSAQSVLVKGQRIKVPIYLKGNKPATEPQNAMSRSGVASSPELVPDSSKTNIGAIPQIRDTEKDKVRLMMIEATLELNEAMVEGAKVSLDSMELSTSSIGEEKDPRLRLHKIKLERDRALLMPYILHIQDSLMQEIAILKAEKLEIEYRISPPVVENDTVIADSEMIIYETTRYADNRPAEKTVKQVINRPPETLAVLQPVEKKAGKNIPGQMSDVSQLGPHQPAGPAKNATDLKAASTATSNSYKAYDMVQHADSHFDKTRDTSVALKIRIPNTNDSFVIKPVAKPHAETKVKTETGRKLSGSRLNNTDSIRRIKAEFFLERAQQAISGKNFDIARQYLNKSIELNPDYFDAWFALANVDDQTSAQQKALKDLEICLRIDSAQPKLFFMMGNLYAKLKRKNEAYEAYSRAILIQPELPALMSRAAILADRKDFQEAISDYNQVLHIDRLYYSAYKARGLVKLMTKEFASAADDFTLFLLFESKDPSAYYYRGLAKIANSEMKDGCLDLSTASGLGYAAAEKAIKKSCQ